MRTPFAFPATLLLALLAGRTAAASPTYPGLIKDDLSLSYTPDCTLCHVGNPGTGTATTPFAKAMRAAGLAAERPDLLKSALAALDKAHTDSDGNGTSDIDQLRAGTDPNGGLGGSIAAPPLAYGCFASSIAPGANDPDRSGARARAMMMGALVIALLIALRRSRRSVPVPIVAKVAVGATVLLAAACYNTAYVATETCAAGLEWQGGNSGSELMNPGMACISCHERGGPRFVVSGTVFAKGHEADTCFGVHDAYVVVTGADGKSVRMEANTAGNFYTDLPVKMPYRAMVVRAGKQTQMVAAQTSGDCNTCHTQQGTSSAPGRIAAP